MADVHRIADPRRAARDRAARGSEFWVERLPTGGIYVRYTEVRDVSGQQVEEMEALARAHPDEPVILDLRQNPGGGTTTTIRRS